VCCGDLTRAFPITAATVTHHLRILSGAGLVETWRDGQFIRVRALPGRLAEYARAIDDFVPAAGCASTARLASAGRMS
jgi:ArsR family transcriptional regulator